MKVYERKEDRICGCEGGRDSGERLNQGGELGRGRKRGHCVSQGRKADRSYDWFTEFPLDAAYVSRSVGHCLHVLLHFYRGKVRLGGSWNNGIGCD